MGLSTLFGGILGGKAIDAMGGKNTPPPPPPPSGGMGNPGAGSQGTNIKAEQVKAAASAAHDATMEQGDSLGQSKKVQAATAAQGTAYRDTSKEMGIM